MMDTKLNQSAAFHPSRGRSGQSGSVHRDDSQSNPKGTFFKTKEGRGRDRSSFSHGSGDGADECFKFPLLIPHSMLLVDSSE